MTTASTDKTSSTRQPSTMPQTPWSSMTLPIPFRFVPVQNPEKTPPFLWWKEHTEMLQKIYKLEGWRARSLRRRARLVLLPERFLL
jgi:hypothetical protein